ncbi:hypothetical protein LOAG_10207 [Loa loa]|uniref:Uncharacterized protein n=1 Tax=Loa loa TaxID=7209 RepID=A0A1S0TQH9_LOALO|nr:hypothetical protein LOAG_10207 [Loa loa]EFO18290.1 hypothetical protein LOAG_10207 [Loa loa]
MWNNQQKLIMEHTSKTFENILSPDVLNDKSESSCISPLHLNPDIFTRLLETPKKFKSFEKFEQDQENTWNCNRQIPSSPSHPNYNTNSYVIMPDGNNYDEALVGKNTDTVSLSVLSVQCIKLVEGSAIGKLSEPKLGRSQILDSTVLQDNKHPMNITPEATSSDVVLDSPDDSDISWCTSSSLSGNGDILIPERIEEKRNESSFEALPSNDLDSSTLHKVDILEEADPTSSNIPRHVHQFLNPI